MPSRSVILGVLVILASVACRNVTPHGTFFDSVPPGAELLVDGRRTGFVTPCLVHLSPTREHEVRIELAGFEPRELWLVPAERADEVRWRDGAIAANGMRTVFGLEARDIVTPYRMDYSLAPSRLFLRLEPTASP